MVSTTASATLDPWFVPGVLSDATGPEVADPEVTGAEVVVAAPLHAAATVADVPLTRNTVPAACGEERLFDRPIVRTCIRATAPGTSVVCLHSTLSRTPLPEAGSIGTSSRTKSAPSQASNLPIGSPTTTPTARQPRHVRGRPGWSHQE